MVSCRNNDLNTLIWSYKYLLDERSELPLVSSRNVIDEYITVASRQDSARDFEDFRAIPHKSCTILLF